MSSMNVQGAGDSGAGGAPPEEAVGARAAAAAGHHEGARAACRILDAGGSAADAAIAASAVLAVAMPHATTLGGDAFVLVRDAAGGRVYGLNASGTAPGRADAEHFRGGMPQRGALAAVVPGLVRGWEALHRRFGKRTWNGLFEDALRLAEEGLPVSAPLAQTLASLQAQLLRDPGCAQAFFPEGVPLAAGSMLHQPALGRTFRSIAEQGADSFYTGAPGAALTRYIESRGGLLSMEDLQGYAAQWVEPLHTAYMGHEVWAMPPNSFGALMLLQLQALAALPREALRGDALTRTCWQIRAMRACFESALAEIGDPASMRCAAEQLLAPDRIAEVRARMLAGPPPAPSPAHAGTSTVTVADAAGNAVCIVQSIFNPFGAHFLDPRTGLVMNNRMFGFDVAPGRINSVAPGKRCAHTLNPVLVTQGGALRWVYASPGGVSQTITGTQVLVNLIDRGMGVAAAVHGQRWATDRSGGILVEPAAAAQMVPALAAAGIAARREEDEYLFGSATLIQVDADGRLRAAGDRRRQAHAMAI